MEPGAPRRRYVLLAFAQFAAFFASAAPAAVTWNKVHGGFASPIEITNAHDGSQRLFVAQQTGVAAPDAIGLPSALVCGQHDRADDRVEPGGVAPAGGDGDSHWERSERGAVSGEREPRAGINAQTMLPVTVSLLPLTLQYLQDLSGRGVPAHGLLGKDHPAVHGDLEDSP